MRSISALLFIALILLVAGLDPASSPGASEPQGAPPASAVDQVKALLEQDRLEEAESTARRLLAEAERVSGPESLQAADAIDALQLVRWRPGRDGAGDEAKRLMERAVRIRQRVLGPEHLDVASSLNSLFRILMSREEYQEAARIAQRVLSIREKNLPPDSLILGRAVANLALVEWRLGDLAPSRRHFDRALSIFRIGGAPERPDQGILLNSMALLLQELGDYQAARDALERVVSIGERPGGVQREVAGAYRNLCSLLTVMGDYSAAKAACDRCLEIREVDPGPGTREYANGLHVTARLLVATGEDAAARPLIEQALGILRSKNAGESLDYSGYLSVYGRILLHLGDLAGARVQLEEELRIMGRFYPADHPDFAEERVALGEVYWRLGDMAVAWQSALGAAGIARSNLRETAAGVSEREALRFESIRVSSMDLLLSLLLFSSPAAAPRQSPGVVLDEQIRSRAIVLDEIASRHRLPAEGGGDLEALQSALVRARTKLSRLIVGAGNGTSQDRYQELVREAEEERDRAERDLAARSTDFRRRLGRERVGLREVAAALPRRSALVAYVRFQRIGESGGKPTPSYMAFVLGAGADVPSAIPLGAASEIDEMIQRWRQEAGTNPEVKGRAASEESYREAGAALRRRIWDPVAAALPAAEMVVVVPDGHLNLVSFATLPREDGGYLIESGPLLHYASAERDLVLDPSARPHEGKLLALGGADFDTQSRTITAEGPVQPPQVPQVASYRSPAPACSDLRTLRFEPLEGSLTEVREIESLWSRKGRVVALTGGSASEGTLKRDAARASVLHVATHAFFMQERCAPVPAGPAPTDSPFLLSGLALAGANARNGLPADSHEEDGILTAEEISALDLSGVNWAVLSACGTGLGKVVSGEGVLGLRRAFEVAGVGTLVMSLWNVEDDATRIWMRGLYEARLSGMRTADAVRAAGLKMLQERRRVGRTAHPFYWGGFVAAGDWR